MTEALVPSLREYSARFGLTPSGPRRLPEHALVMHPGPMNRGVEILVDPAELPGSVITAAGRQRRRRAHGRAVRPPRRPGRDRSRTTVGDEHVRAIRGRHGRRPGGGAARRRAARRRPDRRRRRRPRRRHRARRRRVRRVRPGSSTSTCTCASPGARRPRPIETGSRAAALGGFTAVVAMPNTDPPQDAVGVIEFVRRRGEAGRAVRGAAGRLHHRRAGRGRRWHRSASWPPPACGCSPTTATACRTRC